ncbi:MAG: site-2 protease family protein, partial [Erysipelotrichaceae bacterium]|nr:site-2 protease family protein [Erysipelotrichaceae bacterium]
GGYCAMAGDNETALEETPDAEALEIPEERTLTGIAKWKKIIILLSGVFMNFLLALLVVGLVYLSVGKVAVSPKPVINEVKEGYPAYDAGLMKDDEIIEARLANGYTLAPETFAEFSDFLLLYEEGEIELTVKRGDETLNIGITPRYDEEAASYKIGITSYEYDLADVNIFNCFTLAFSYLKEMTKLIWTAILGLFKGVGLNNLSGPVGIYNVTSEAVSYGLSSYFLLAAVLSLNIGIFNLVPIPALDGGRVVLTVIEAVIRKPIPKKIENFIMTISVILFIVIFIFATSQDILKLLG